MKKMNLAQMENLQGGSNRQCMIDGALTIGMVVVGGFAGVGGMLGGLLGGVGMANANGCFK